jgi:hypothetical protein
MEKDEELLLGRGVVRWGDALIFTSSFSYVSALIAAVLGYPAMRPDAFPVYLQGILYVSMFFLLLLSFLDRRIRWVVAAGYGLSAMLSFTGLQPWVSYMGDSQLLGPAMAAWDLLLAVALLTRR